MTAADRRKPYTVRIGPDSLRREARRRLASGAPLACRATSRTRLPSAATRAPDLAASLDQDRSHLSFSLQTRWTARSPCGRHRARAGRQCTSASTKTTTTGTASSTSSAAVIFTRHWRYVGALPSQPPRGTRPSAPCTVLSAARGAPSRAIPRGAPGRGQRRTASTEPAMTGGVARQRCKLSAVAMPSAAAAATPAAAMRAALRRAALRRHARDRGEAVVL